MTPVTTLTHILLYSFLSYNFFSFFTLPPPLLFIYSRGFISPVLLFPFHLNLLPSFTPSPLLPIVHRRPFHHFYDICDNSHSYSSIFLPFLQLLLFFYSSSTPLVYLFSCFYFTSPTFPIPSQPTTLFHSFPSSSRRPQTSIPSLLWHLWQLSLIFFYIPSFPTTSSVFLLFLHPLLFIYSRVFISPTSYFSHSN
jgi:hypothetical protein